LGICTKEKKEGKYFGIFYKITTMVIFIKAKKKKRA